MDTSPKSILHKELTVFPAIGRKESQIMTNPSATKRAVFSNPSIVEARAISRLVHDNKIEIVDLGFWQNSRSGSNLLLDFAENKHDYDEILKRASTGSFHGIDARFLADEIFIKYSPEIQLANQMLDRLDISGNQTHGERKLIIQYIVCYWLQALEKSSPVIAYFTTTPHEVVDYCLYLALKSREIEIFMLLEVTSFNRRLLINDFNTNWDPIHVKGLSEFSASEVNPVISKMQGTHEEAMHSSINQGIESQRQLRRISIFETVKSLTNAIIRTQKRAAAKLSKEEKFESKTRRILQVVVIVVLDIASKLQQRNYIRSIQKFYKEISIDKIPTSPYVYFCLNFQPESTTNPSGNIYTDQHIAVAQLARQLPVGWKILVKEHPIQFYKTGYYGYLGRDRAYYSRLQQISNVEIASMNSDHFDLLDNSEFVASITGTVAFEALCRNIPALLFGNVWFQSHPSCLKVNNLTHELNLEDFTISARERFKDQGISEYLRVALNNSFQIFVSEEESRWAGETWSEELNENSFLLLMKQIFCGEPEGVVDS
jgi:hypothetical protein